MLSAAQTEPRQTAPSSDRPTCTGREAWLPVTIESEEQLWCLSVAYLRCPRDDVRAERHLDAASWGAANGHVEEDNRVGHLCAKLVCEGGGGARMR